MGSKCVSVRLTEIVGKYYQMKNSNRGISQLNQKISDLSMSSEVVTPDDEEIRCHSCLDDEYVGGVVLVLGGGVAMTNEFLMTL